MGRVVGIDFGLARIGVALSDPSKMIASTLGKIEAKKKSVETAKTLLAFLTPYQDEIELLLLGHPLHLNGKVGHMADEVLYFKGVLEEIGSYPVLLWDERLSSMQAERSLKESKMNRKKRAQVVDGVAAALLLQSYLDSIALASNY